MEKITLEGSTKIKDESRLNDDDTYRIVVEFTRSLSEDTDTINVFKPGHYKAKTFLGKIVEQFVNELQLAFGDDGEMSGNFEVLRVDAPWVNPNPQPSGGPVILLGKQYPHDPHLYMCIVQWGPRKYSTHMYNADSNGLAFGHYYEVWNDAMAGTPLNASWAAVAGDFAHRCDALGVTLDAKQIVLKEVTHG